MPTRQKSRYLCKRGETYYFRFSNQEIDVKLSLRTNDLYEASYLRDKILRNLVGGFMSTNIAGKIKNSDLLRQSAINILKKERLQSGGGLDVPDQQINRYPPPNKPIKDQAYLEKFLRQYLTVIEKERLINDGRLPEHRIYDLKLWTDPEILYHPISPEELEELESPFGVYVSEVDNTEYIVQDSLELNMAIKEALFNISIEYLAKHYSSPVTASNQDDYNTLIELGVIKKIGAPAETIATTTDAPCVEELKTEKSSSGQRIKTFRNVVDEYVEEKKVSDDVKENTVDDAIKMLNVAMGFFGADVEIAAVNNRPNFLNYKKALKSIPTNRNKSKYKNLSIRELAELKHDSSTMKTATSNKYLMYLTSLFKYAEERDYISKSQAYKLQDKNKVHPRDQNDRFMSDELVVLFTTLKNQYGGRKKQEKFWIPLIALFTSCRLNEICQLTYKDVDSPI